MCGIAGLVGAISPRNRDALKRMSDAISHRGPDSSGFWEAEPDANGWGPMLAHRRLSILDLSPAGAQPMRDPETGNTIVFNGEIYNYVELRTKLEAQGQRLWSSGDTAVLLRSLSLQGAEAVSAMRGMFAFAFWDLRRHELILSRDVLGIKPLYLVRNPDPQGEWSIAFASEVRALLASGLLTSPRLNPEAVASIVWNGFTVAPETSIVGLESLSPGESRSFNSGGLELARRRDWPLPPPGTDGPLDEDGLARELEECVRLHLSSDVPLGVFLSGGIDSSVVANLAQKTSTTPVHTFTMTFEEEARNEGVFARRISQAIGTDHQELLLTQGKFVGRLDAALDSLDQPTFDGLNSYFMSHAVRDAGFKVALVGSGGDELFGGYTSFRDLPPMVRWGKRLKFLPKGLKGGAAQLFSSMLQPSGRGFPPQVRWAKLPEMVRSEDDLLALYQLAYALFLPSTQNRLLSRPSKTVHGLPAVVCQQLLEETRGRSALEAIAILEQRLFLGERLLRDTDAVSMSASIEIRLPLVDQHLLRQMNRIDPQLRFQPLRTKALLRRVGLRGLDRGLWDRPKSGFELPFNDWMKSTLGDAIDATLRDHNAVVAAGLEPKAVVRLWEAFRKGTPGLYWSRVWALYVLVRWARRHHLTV